MDINVQLVALYGAVLSTVLALLEFHKAWNEKPHLRVKVNNVYEYDTQKGNINKIADINITVANRGKRPVTITQINLYPPKKSGKRPYSFLSDDVEISDGKRHSVTQKIGILGFSSSKCVACAVDATGRLFWSDNCIIRLLKIRRACVIAPGRFIANLFRKLKRH